MSDLHDLAPSKTTSTLKSFFATRSIHAAPVLLWLIIQLIALGLSAARVPLWANPPAPIESIAAQQMIAVQIAASATLFGWLMPNLVTGVCVIAVSA